MSSYVPKTPGQKTKLALLLIPFQNIFICDFRTQLTRPVPFETEPAENLD